MPTGRALERARRVSEYATSAGPHSGDSDVRPRRPFTSPHLRLSRSHISACTDKVRTVPEGVRRKAGTASCSLPPCGGGLGRGVFANSEFPTTPLPVPPPLGGRERWSQGS